MNANVWGRKHVSALFAEFDGPSLSEDSSAQNPESRPGTIEVKPGPISAHVADLSLRAFGEDDEALEFGTTLALDSEGRLQVEYNDITHIPLGWMNRLEQTRQTYDADKIVALARAIEMKGDDDSDILKLIAPPQVVALDTREELDIYLRDHAEFYGKNTDPDILRQAPDGRWYLIDAGHRRSLALEYFALKSGIDVDDVQVPTSVLEGMTFEQALGIQIRENEHDRPPLYDEALSIERYFRFRQKRQKTMPTHQQIAEHYGISTRKVSNALQFAQLPEDVQREVKTGKISWRNGLHLHRLQKVLHPYYTRKYAAVYAKDEDRTLEKDVCHELMAVINRLKSGDLSRASAEQKAKVIQGRIDAITSELSTDELFQIEHEPTPLDRRIRSSRELATKAIVIVRSTLEEVPFEQMPIEELQALIELVTARLERQAQLQEPVADLFSA